MSSEGDGDGESHGPLGDPDDAPQVQDIKGKWDEVVSAVILVAPWVVILAVGLWTITTGSLTTDIRIAGEIPVFWLALGAGVLMGATYVLAMLKFFGSKPVAWLGNKLHNIARDYKPDE